MCVWESVCLRERERKLSERKCLASNIPSIPSLTQQGVNINAQPQHMCNSALFCIRTGHCFKKQGRIKPKVAIARFEEKNASVTNDYLCGQKKKHLETWINISLKQCLLVMQRKCPWLNVQNYEKCKGYQNDNKFNVSSHKNRAGSSPQDWGLQDSERLGQTFDREERKNWWCSSNKPSSSIQNIECTECFPLSGSLSKISQFNLNSLDGISIKLDLVSFVSGFPSIVLWVDTNAITWSILGAWRWWWKQKKQK